MLSKDMEWKGGMPFNKARAWRKVVFTSFKFSAAWLGQPIG